MHEEAADAYSKANKNKLAANSYLLANIWDKAAVHFEKAEEYVKAADAYKDGSHYDELIKLLQR
jgi:hypothetical protein